jgi:hypothetical protein
LDDLVEELSTDHKILKYLKILSSYNPFVWCFFFRWSCRLLFERLFGACNRQCTSNGKILCVSKPHCGFYSTIKGHKRRKIEK